MYYIVPIVSVDGKYGNWIEVVFHVLGLPRDHPESYHSFMFNNFFRHIDIDPANVHILDGNAKDLAKECEDYEKKIKEAGGIELFIGGSVLTFFSFTIAQ